MKPNREAIRARMLVQAEKVIDNILDWETTTDELTKTEIQEKLSVESRQLEEDFVSILLASNEADTPAQLGAKRRDAGDTSNTGDIEDDLEVEIHDLPSDGISALSAVFLKLSSQFSPQRGRQALKVAAFLFLVILLILSYIPAVHDRVWSTLSPLLPPTPTPTVQPGPQSGIPSGDQAQIVLGSSSSTNSSVTAWAVNSTPTVISPLGPVPNDCPAGPTPQKFDAAFAPGVGSDAVWVVGFKGPHATLSNFPQTQPGPNGWPHLLTVVVRQGGDWPIALHGWNMNTDAPLWFGGIQPEDESTTAIWLYNHDNVLQLGHHEWITLKTYVYVPVAGCYYLEATWPGGHWRITFAAGQ